MTVWKWLRFQIAVRVIRIGYHAMPSGRVKLLMAAHLHLFYDEAKDIVRSGR